VNQNTINATELTRRGMTAIEERLRRGPVHIVKRNKPVAVVLSEDEYQRLAHGRPAASVGMTAVQWLPAQPTFGKPSKAQIDARLTSKRAC
jgi:hypothetical protein